MNFGELKDELVALINRKDLTTVRAGRFLNRAVDRLERNVRLPFMERLVEYTITDSPDIDLPTDFIERSEERRVGKECVSRVDLGGSRFVKNKKRNNIKTQ